MKAAQWTVGVIFCVIETCKSLHCCESHCSASFDVIVLCQSAQILSLASFFSVCDAVVTCEIKLLQNFFSVRRRSSEIILPEIISEV